MTLKLTLDALLVLDAIDKRGTFAAAATALYRVPSAITYTVQKLEEDLNVQLFRKEGRRHILTPAGENLLASGRELLAFSDQIITRTQEIDRGVEPRLRIVLNTVYEMCKLYPAINALVAQFPNLDIELSEESLGGAWEALDTDRADLIIGDSEKPDHVGGIESLPLPDLEWVFAVHPAHPLTKEPSPITQDQIAHYRAIVVKDTSQLSQPLTRRVLNQQNILRVDTMQEKIYAQAAGLGVGYLPKHRIRDLIDQSKLVSLELDEVITSTEMEILWKRDACGKALNWFIDHLQTEQVINSLFG